MGGMVVGGGALPAKPAAVKDLRGDELSFQRVSSVTQLRLTLTAKPHYREGQSVKKHVLQQVTHPGCRRLSHRTCK